MSAIGVSSGLSAARRPAAVVARIVLNWIAIVAVFAVVARHPYSPYMLVGVVLIGIEQHALGLWMHEGVHWLIAGKKRRNDLIVTALLSGPLFVPLHAFRERHLLHHAHLGAPEDTKSVIFSRLDGRHFWLFLVKNCLGLQVLAIAMGYFARNSAARPSVRASTRLWVADIAGIGITQGVLLFVVGHISEWTLYLWFWVLPWLTINRFINGLRSVIEHQPLASEHHPFTRRLRPTPLDRMLFCRAGFEYHWAHHLCPNVPYFNLASVDRLRAEAPLSTPGYLETLLLLTRSPHRPAHA